MKEGVIDIRGHHLVDLANFLQKPEELKEEYCERGYGEEFVSALERAYYAIINGKVSIHLVAGVLDETCNASCEQFTSVPREQQLPCTGARAQKIDEQVAGFMLLEIGKTYTFEDIEQKLRNFYSDQHCM
ncbi:MAG TPA: DUF1284 domain-containing protein [Candidatus Nanoarchaeia archaeon]|nr:DUF1284 domain-containing protein [Candidatus Nanoarchaeia archaeon]